MVDVKFGSTALSQHFLQRSCELVHSTSNSSLRTPNSYLNRLLKVQNFPFYNCGGCYYAARK